MLKTCPVLENVCLYAKPERDYVVAVAIPDREKAAEQYPGKSLAKLIEEDKEFRASLLSGVQSHGLSNGLQRFEMPAKLVLTADEWTPDSGLVTAAFKIRRRHIVDKYRDRLEEVYV